MIVPLESSGKYFEISLPSVLLETAFSPWLVAVTLGAALLLALVEGLSAFVFSIESVSFATTF